MQVRNHKVLGMESKARATRFQSASRLSSNWVAPAVTYYQNLQAVMNESGYCVSARPAEAQDDLLSDVRNAFITHPLETVDLWSAVWNTVKTGQDANT